MKLLSWNCAMKFREKFSKVESFNADIMIIQETEHPIRLPDELNRRYNIEWVGDIPHKGLGIFLRKSIDYKVAPFNESNNKWFLPIEVELPVKMLLVGVWAHNHRKNEVIDKVPPTFRSIKMISKLFRDETIICGDFNSNANWDRMKKYGRFMDTVDFLGTYNIHSLYHELKSEGHGAESESTLVWRKNLNSTYHVDYCFMSKSLIERNSTLEIGDYDRWIKFSDHKPLFIDTAIWA